MLVSSEKKKKKNKQTYSSKINRNPKFNIIALSFVAIGLGLVGYFIIFSRAAGNNTSAEAENGQLSGNATSLSDSSASGGKYVRLGQATTGSGADPILPEYSGTCPTFTNGTLTFNDGTGSRSVLVRMDSNASTNNGPLVILWHGQKPPDDLDQIFSNLLGNSTTTDIANKGGVVVAPTMYKANTWDNASSWSTSNRDLSLTDTIVACAKKQNLIDAKRIHAIGMSWGGYQTSHLSYLRSNYIASSVVMSGGFTGSPASGAIQRPSNKFATIATIGSVSAGELSMVVAPLQGYRDFAKSNGQAVTYCQHSSGHFPIPNGGPMHQRFFADHPYGTPNAYSGALPNPPFLSSCVKY